MKSGNARVHGTRPGFRPTCTNAARACRHSWRVAQSLDKSCVALWRAAKRSRADSAEGVPADILLRLVAQICPRWNHLQPWFELVEAFKDAAVVGSVNDLRCLLTSLLSAVGRAAFSRVGTSSTNGSGRLEAFGRWREEGLESTGWILKTILVLKVSDEPLKFGFLTKGFEVWVDCEEGPASEPVSTQRSSMASPCPFLRVLHTYRRFGAFEACQRAVWRGNRPATSRAE